MERLGATHVDATEPGRRQVSLSHDSPSIPTVEFRPVHFVLVLKVVFCSTDLLELAQLDKLVPPSN
jgi:hypothetical protein